MKRFFTKDINSPKYWDTHQTATDFGLRQKKYLRLAGKGTRIAEFGCGVSQFLDKAQTKFSECWGIDFSHETMRNFDFLYPNVNRLVSDVQDTPFPRKYFDISVSGEVIEHLKEPENLIKEMARTTKYKIIISTPHLEFEDPEHLWEFSGDDLLDMLTPYGDTKVETIKSERFPGREYLFATCTLKKL